MKKMLKKIFLIGLATVTIMNLSACGGDKSSSSSDVPTLKLWHIYGNDTDPNKEVMDQVTKEAEKKFNVKIKVDTAENESYKTKIKAAIAANETPDIFYTWGNGFIKPFVEAEKILPLDEYLTEEYKSHLEPSTLTGFQFDEKTYALTTDVSVACLFCNSELFETNGLEIPTTWEDFVAVCKAFKEKGITPLTVGGKETWTIAMYHDLLALRNVGTDGVKAATSKQTDFSNTGFLKAAEQLSELVNINAFPDGSAGISREESEIPFLEGETPMYLNGSWTATRVYKDSSKVKDKIVVVPFPTVDESKSTSKDFTGGPDTAFAVSSSTKYPDLAAQVAQYIAYESSVGKYKIGSTLLPYSNVEIDDSNINPLLKEIYNLTKDAKSYTIWWDNLMEGKDSTIYLNKLQELFTGNITPEQYISELNKLNN